MRDLFRRLIWSGDGVFVAHCIVCSWQGPLRRSERKARNDLADHLFDRGCL